MNVMGMALCACLPAGRVASGETLGVLRKTLGVMHDATDLPAGRFARHKRNRYTLVLHLSGGMMRIILRFAVAIFVLPVEIFPGKS